MRPARPHNFAFDAQKAWYMPLQFLEKDKSRTELGRPEGHVAFRCVPDGGGGDADVGP